MTKKEKGRTPKAVPVPDKVDEVSPAPVAKRQPRAVELTTKIVEPDQDFYEIEGSELSDNQEKSASGLGTARFWRIGTWFITALGVLLTLAIGIWTDTLLRNLFERNDWLGWVGLTAAAVTVLTLLILLLREIIALVKLRSTGKLQDDAQRALAASDQKALKQLSARLVAHLDGLPSTAAARATLNANKDAIIDPEDLYALTEKELLSGIDRQARQMVMSASKRVSLVTAISPRALIDIGYVLYANIRLIRRISELYGGRGGTLGTIRLVRNVIAHLAVTGTIAIGDGLVQQLIGHGLAARLSARLGEGIINGMMTARIGLAAIETSRPVPFHALPKPTLREFANVLARTVEDEAAKESDKPSQ